MTSSRQQGFDRIEDIKPAYVESEGKITAIGYPRANQRTAEEGER